MGNVNKTNILTRKIYFFKNYLCHLVDSTSSVYFFEVMAQETGYLCEPEASADHFIITK